IEGGVWYVVLVVRYPGCMREQMFHGDVSAICWKAWKSIGKRSGQCHFSFADQLKDTGSCKLLGHRGQPEIGIRYDSLSMLEVGIPITSLKQHPAILDNQQRRPRVFTFIWC